MYSDSTADSILGTAELSTTITNGQFAFPANNSPSSFGVLRVVTAAEGTSKVGGEGGA